MNLLEDVLATAPEITRIRRDIHAHPELCFEEHRTADVVAERLQAWGIEVHRGLAGTGVIGVIRGKDAGASGRAIGLRADMDALPVQEKNKFAHASQHAGKMHACGHDGHTAMLLAGARHLAAHRDFDGTVYVIFQPAEEDGGGARVMLEEGLLEKFPMQAVFGMHNIPGIPAGHIAVKAGPMMASYDMFEITITGRGSHGAMPHKGIDPIVIGAELTQKLQTVVSRNVDPIDPAVLSVTKFHSGSAWNVIPNEAVLGGTVRAFDTRVQDLIESRIRELCAGTAASHGAEIHVRYERRYPPTVNHAEQAALCTRVAEALVGHDRVNRDPRPAMGSEDFAWMLLSKPGCYVWIGNGTGSEGGCMVHNPGYDFNDGILSTGAAYWVKLAETALAQA